MVQPDGSQRPADYCTKVKLSLFVETLLSDLSDYIYLEGIGDNQVILSLSQIEETHRGPRLKPASDLS